MIFDIKQFTQVIVTVGVIGSQKIKIEKVLLEVKFIIQINHPELTNRTFY